MPEFRDLPDGKVSVTFVAGGASITLVGKSREALEARMAGYGVDEIPAPQPEMPPVVEEDAAEDGEET